MNEKSIFNITRDFCGMVVLAFALFSVAALVSHHSQDPSYNSFGSSLTTQTLNKGGIVGAYLSDFLVQLFGGGSFFFPLILFYAAWTLIRGNSFSRLPIIISAGSFFLINLCSFFHIHFLNDPYFGDGVNSGGIVGSFLGEIFKKWLNIPGAYLTVITFSAISLLALTGISANSVVEWIFKVIKDASSFFIAICKLTYRTCLNIDPPESSEVENKNETPTAIKISSPKPKEKENKKDKEPIIVSLVPEITPELAPKKSKKSETPFATKDLTSPKGDDKYIVPALDILDDIPPPTDHEKSRENILARSKTLEKKLADFGIEGRVVQVLPGPVITLYEFEPAPGIKVSRIVALTDDLALAMRAPSVRILAPVPGKPVVGIEIPNPNREIVYFKEIIASDVFKSSPSKLTMALGKDNVGNPVAVDLAQVPHLLIAGATGSGKSVGINALVCSILLNATPDEVQLIMIDPKMLEFSMYDGIPHLIAPVVTNPKKATTALQWAVTEMERRYKLMSEKGVRNITGYNESIELEKAELKKKNDSKKKTDGEPDEDEPKPQPKFSYIVIVIDELADLMMVASKGVEEALMRLAQMARASGIHLILATQRPSVDVLTGVIKANFPARISFQVTSRVDSRTILDSIGAEKLLGKGDMLFLPPSSSRIVRIHGVMVKDSEINRIIKLIKEQKRPEYREDIFVAPKITESTSDEEEEFDEKYDEAVALVAREQQASISMVQRKLRVGYNRAARMIEVMEKEGVVGRSDGIKPRAVLIKEIPA
jgi:DNA segregation ATPase FtsK/SpoIIIE, S-DNA-T family